MAAAFRPVNTQLASDSQTDHTMTTSPTTPRQATAPQPLLQPKPAATEDPTTPTRNSFGPSALSSQKPLPSSPFPDAVHIPEGSEGPKLRISRDSEDIEMGDSDGDTAGADEAVASDDDSVNGDGSRSGKKKKSQRFYCTDYPPCNLSFTRSEHLARHIRKHTGERPFQCHCSRRFSRLDNLRQHAQTVHVNEEIPMDSLAASGSRFQRQIRTDRIRPTGGRARAGSGSAPARGHSKSLSTSSIGSVSSIGSAYGGVRDDPRRRPPPLVMANDPRSRASMEAYRAVDGSYVYRPVTPTDFGTPASGTFSTGPTSPRWGSTIGSPTTSHSRSQSLYSIAGARTPGRRLSVPSGANPFQSPHGPPLRSSFGPGSINASNSGSFSPANSSILASPTTPGSGWSGRRDSGSVAGDEAWRRRTWHPESRSFNPSTSSNLSSVVSSTQFQPSPPPPLTTTPNPHQSNVRLPGIESFDPLPPRQPSPLRRAPSPMAVDTSAVNPPTLLPNNDPAAEERRNIPWDMGLHRGLNRLDIRSDTGGGAGAWANDANQAVQAQAEHARANPPTVRFEIDSPPPSHSNTAAYSSMHQHTLSAPTITTPREAKRHGWYHGPVTVHAPPPAAESGMEGRGSRVDRMIHPNMSEFSGFPGRDQGANPQTQVQRPQQPREDERTSDGGSSRFDALVAVAASEGSTAAAY